MSEKNSRKEVAKSLTGIGLGIGLAKLAVKSKGGLLGSILSTASNVLFSSGSFRAANFVTDAVVEKLLSKKESKCRIKVRETEEEK